MKAKLWLSALLSLLGVGVLFLASACRTHPTSTARGSSASFASQQLNATNLLSASALQYIQEKAKERSRISELERTLEKLYQKAITLTAENEALRRTNLLMEKRIESSAARTNRISETSALIPQASIAQDLDRWLTKSTLKRHNRSCPYFEHTEGHKCDASVGVPCRLCGG
jgi:hypothetical protein